MRDAFRSIQFRLTLWFLSVLSIAIVLVSMALYFGLQRALIANVDATLRRAAERSVRATQENAPTDDGVSALVLFSLAPTRLISMDGAQSQADALFPTDLAVDDGALADARQGIARYETVTLATGVYRVLSAPVRIEGERSAVVQVAQSLANELAALNSLRNLMLLIAPVALLLAAGGGALLTERALKPMEQVRRDVEMIIDDSDLSRRVSHALAPDEVGKLAHTFDRLLERIETAMARERQFSADASHELRSPLTALKGELSLALSRPRSAAEYHAVLSGLESAVDDMSVMVEDLLTLSRQGGVVLRLERLDLSEITRGVAERAANAARAQSIELSLAGAERPAWVLGDRLKLQRVLVNLIDNAIRYTPGGGAIQVVIEPSDEHVVLRVRDTGIGIATQHQTRIFDRFYRVDSSRARDVGGAGLGLAIVQSLVIAHSGHISVRSTPGRGSEFTVQLPRRGEN
jgi:heavy metal sensor kinase